MELVDAIRKRGFRKWYERQLIESHLYLVTCILCMILVGACIEEFSSRAHDLTRLAMIGAIFGGSWLGLFSWRRYRTMMTVAQRYGDHSTCAQCGTYARFDVVDWGDPAPAAAASLNAIGAGTWLKVRCRKCGHLWTMD